MKGTHYFFSQGLVIAAIVIFAFVSIWIQYNDNKKHLLEELNQSFISAIYQEKEIRLNRVDLDFSHHDSNVPTQQIVIQKDSSTILFEKSDKLKKMSFYEKQNHADHTFLFYKNIPVNLHVLDSIFQITLFKSHIFAQTVIKYSDTNHLTRYSCNDSSMFESTLQTTPVMLGFGNEITLQAFARLTIYHFILSNPIRFVYICLICIVATGILMLFKLITKKNVVTVYSEIIEHSEPPVIKDNPKPTEFIRFDSENFLLYYRESEIKLTNQSFNLFVFLWDHPCQFINYQDLAIQLFGAKNMINVENRIAQAINRLRRNLQEIPELEIENIPQKGYRILVKNKISMESDQEVKINWY